MPRQTPRPRVPSNPVRTSTPLCSSDCKSSSLPLSSKFERMASSNLLHQDARTSPGFHVTSATTVNLLELLTFVPDVTRFVTPLLSERTYYEAPMAR